MCEEDHQLTDLAKAGSLSAFDELVRRHRNSAVMAARSVLNRSEDVQDAVQEAFLIAFKNLPQLEDGSAFGPWVLAIARRRARRRLSEKATTPLSDVDQLILKKSFEISKIEWQGREHAQLVEKSLEALIEEDRRLMELAAEGVPDDEGAKRLGISLAAYKSRLHRIRQKLRTKWDIQQ